MTDPTPVPEHDTVLADAEHALGDLVTRAEHNNVLDRLGRLEQAIHGIVDSVEHVIRQ